jgi:hypothetical protein
LRGVLQQRSIIYMVKNFYKYIAAVCLPFFFAVSAIAQKPLVTSEKKIELDQLSASLESTYNANLKKAMALAPQNNWITRKKYKNGTIISLQKISPLGYPLYYKTYNNTTAAATTRTNTVQPGGALGLNLSGSSSNLDGKLAIWDGGSVLTNHQEFVGKTITLHDAAAADEHSTHVAGTLLAKGIYAPARGMAFNAHTLQSYDFDNDVAEITAAASNLLLSNHSYGLVAGWNYDSDLNRWEWYGTAGATEDYKFGYYDSDSRVVDQAAVNAPYYLIVSASGNNRGYPGPAVGTEYFGYDASGKLVSKIRDASISSNTGFDVIPGFSNAKNVLTVGSVNQLPYGPVSRNGVTASYFSSIGPTDDGRIKPDICGDGDAVLSTGSSSTTSYLTLSGTSMATPNVTGSLYLLQEYYAQKNSGAFMRSATLKGLVCQTAFDAGNVGPDYTFGWGVLDMQKAAQAVTDKGGKSIINENTLAQGQTQNINVVASGNGTLVATIAWTDPQATVAATGTLNDRTPKLINDLDIRIIDGANTYSPWVLNYNAPDAAATRGDNIRDNVEQVYIDNVIPGHTYTIRVTHKGTLQGGAQPYSLIATGVGGAAYCASAPTSSADSRINNLTVSNINNTPAAGCTTYSDYTNLTAQLEQGSTQPISLTLGTCGANLNKIARVYIDFNGDGTLDPVTELVATTGVFSATSTYNTNINIPATVIPGNYSLMRVVLVETGTAAMVTPCGTYAKGETQDYRVQFIKATRDAGAIAVSNNVTNGNCAGISSISVRLKNYGSATIGNIPVTVTVTPSNGGAVTILNETYTGTLTEQAEDDFILSGTFTSAAGVTYTLTAITNLPNDQVTANNQITSSVVIGSIPIATNVSASYCDDTKQYALSGEGEGELFWYTTPTGGVPIATGKNTFTQVKPTNNTFYAGLNDFSADIGPAAKASFTSGVYSQAAAVVKVNTKAPVLIQSARLYIGNSGRVKFTVTDANGEEVSATTLNVTATRNPAAAGNQTNDPTDQGRVYNLNLILPKAGNYTIGVTYANGATLFYSNGGVTGYPFGNEVFKITGNNARLSSNPSDTTGYRNFYFYFYNMHVISNGCASVTRQAAMVVSPVITQNGATLQSNIATGNQWYLNDELIAGANGQTYVPQKSGNYQLKNTIVTGCTAISAVYTYINANAVVNTPNEIKMSVFPVPATTELNVTLIAPQDGNLTISLINTIGKTAFTKTMAVKTGNFSTTFGVSELLTGTYVLRAVLGQKVYSTKIIIVR